MPLYTFSGESNDQTCFLTLQSTWTRRCDRCCVGLSGSAVEGWAYYNRPYFRKREILVHTLNKSYAVATYRWRFGSGSVAPSDGRCWVLTSSIFVFLGIVECWYVEALTFGTRDWLVRGLFFVACLHIRAFVWRKVRARITCSSNVFDLQRQFGWKRDPV